jgi:hypothetical protein
MTRLVLLAFAIGCSSTPGPDEPEKVCKLADDRHLVCTTYSTRSQTTAISISVQRRVTASCAQTRTEVEAYARCLKHEDCNAWIECTDQAGLEFGH